jgi:hypothetical protein
VDQTKQIALPKVAERYPKKPSEQPMIVTVPQSNQLQLSCKPVKKRIEVHTRPIKGENKRSFFAKDLLSWILSECDWFIILIGLGLL